MVADIELEASATDHKLLNQQWEFQSLPLHNTNLDGNEKAGAYLQLYSFSFVLCKLFT